MEIHDTLPSWEAMVFCHTLTGDHAHPNRLCRWKWNRFRGEGGWTNFASRRTARAGPCSMWFDFRVEEPECDNAPVRDASRAGSARLAPPALRASRVPARGEPWQRTAPTEVDAQGGKWRFAVAVPEEDHGHCLLLPLPGRGLGTVFPFPTRRIVGTPCRCRA